MRRRLSARSAQIDGEDLGHQALHLLSQPFDPTLQPVVSGHGRYRHRKPHSRREQGFPYAAGQDGGVYLIAGLLHRLEGGDHAQHGAEQPEERREAADDLQRPQAAAQGFDLIAPQARQLFTQAPFRHIGPLTPTDGQRQQLCGGAALSAEGGQRLLGAAGAVERGGPLRLGGGAQAQELPQLDQNDRERDDRHHEQDDHYGTASVEELQGLLQEVRPAHRARLRNLQKWGIGYIQRPRVGTLRR